MKRLFAAAAVLAVCSQAALAGELTLFTDNDFRGARVTVQRDTPDLGRLGFNDRTSSIVVRSGVWEVCEHAGYGGQCAEFGPGEYRALPRLNDSISSVREVTRGGRGDGNDRGDYRDDRGPGWRGDRDGRSDYRDERGPRGDDRRGDAVQMFSAPRFEGDRIGLSGDARLLGDFNDRAGSIVIREGRWEFCEHADFRGQCVVYGPGRYAFLEQMDHRISSMRRVR